MGLFSLMDSLEGRKQQGGLIFIGINLHLLGSWVKASPKFLLGGTLLGFLGWFLWFPGPVLRNAVKIPKEK